MAKPKATELVEQIKNAKGNISAVARAYKVSRTAVYQWIEATATAKQALADERETMVDIAESALYRNVVKGDNSAIFYTLNNSPEAKRRGWGPRQEITGKEGGPVEVEHSDSPRDKLAGRLSSIATREAADQDTE